MQHQLQALRKAREHVADVAKPAEMAKGHLEERWLEKTLACLRLLGEHAAVGGWFEFLMRCA